MLAPGACPAQDQQLRESGIPAARLRSLHLNTHLSNEKRNSVCKALESPSSRRSDAHPALSLPRGTRVSLPWRLPGCRRCAPGAERSEPGRCGAERDRPADVSVPSLTAARRVPASPGDVARRPLHFFRSGAVFGGRSVTILRPGEQQGAGKGSGSALTPQRRAPSLPNISHPPPYLSCTTKVELRLCITAHL